jgi:hypothetical protein
MQWLETVRPLPDRPDRVDVVGGGGLIELIRSETGISGVSTCNSRLALFIHPSLISIIPIIPSLWQASKASCHSQSTFNSHGLAKVAGVRFQEPVLFEEKDDSAKRQSKVVLIMALLSSLSPREAHPFVRVKDYPALSALYVWHFRQRDPEALSTSFHARIHACIDIFILRCMPVCSLHGHLH